MANSNNGVEVLLRRSHMATCMPMRIGPGNSHGPGPAGSETQSVRRASLHIFQTRGSLVTCSHTTPVITEHAAHPPLCIHRPPILHRPPTADVLPFGCSVCPLREGGGTHAQNRQPTLTASSGTDMLHSGFQASSLGAATDGPPSEIHILLVDDERLSRVVVSNLLKKCNYRGAPTVPQLFPGRFLGQGRADECWPGHVPNGPEKNAASP